MAISHGMNIAEIEAFGNRLQQHFAAQLNGIADEIETVVGQTSGSWVGPDAEKFRSWWPAKRSTLRATADDVHGFGQSALNNAAEQRQASGASGGGTGASSGYARPGGPAPMPVYGESSDRTTKSGAIVRGVDGSGLEMTVMSDGSVQVRVTLTSGLEVDAGDAITLAQIARGKFIPDGPGFDLDATLLTEGETTWTFNNPAEAEAFYDALNGKIGSAQSVVSGMTWGQVRDAMNEAGMSDSTDTSYVMHRGAQSFTLSGAASIDVGDGDQSIGARLTGGAGTTVTTYGSDGSTGELSRMHGELQGSGKIGFGPIEVEGGATTGYERSVHLVRNSDGVPVSLEISESVGGTFDVGAGSKEFLGTGVGGSASAGSVVTTVTSFDLADPAVAAQFGSEGGVSDPYGWAQSNQQLGGQSVAEYANQSVGGTASLLFSGEWSTSNGESTLIGAHYRPPGGDGFSQYAGDMRPPEGMSGQVIQEADGSSSVVFSPEF